MSRRLLKRSGSHLVQDGSTWTAQVPEYTDADAKATHALLGHGSVTVETLRMVKGEEVVVDLE